MKENDKRKNLIRNRDPVTGKILPEVQFDLEQDAYEYLLKKTHNGKDIVDIGLRWIKAHQSKSKIPWNARAAIWKAFYDELKRKSTATGDTTITNYIIMLEDKIMQREEIEVVEVEPTALIEDDKNQP